jgi:outer membrane protein OmpA-like peptidoglycan-associated protein
MKSQKLVASFVLGLGFLSVTGCQHSPVGGPQITEFPKSSPVNATPGAEDKSTALNNPTPTEVSPIGTPESYGSYSNLFNNPNNEDRDKFKADAVYFDFDSATIKPSEEAKLQDLAAYFKGNDKAEGLIVEGNCDERGTEKYNLSLGERRALAAREYLGNLGVDVHRIKTVTYGASKPVASGHNESAWKKNRHDDFVLVTPKQ